MELLYKTRGESSIYGKQRVYFTCHPDDFAQHFTPLSDDILNAFNCVIHYATDYFCADSEGIETTLSQVQLIAVPVTTNFLNDENRARDIELAYAIVNNVPILPIIVEDIDVSDYAGVFGNIQYLDKLNGDDTALTYEDKLQRHLTKILISDGQLENIAGAFDANVFLSYRKADRGYANELIHAVHLIDDYEGVAIWYDEFLTPGENFNEGIASELNGCNAFMLLVTPTLLAKNERGEDNYVVSTEYPAAVTANKPIVAVEMAATNRDELRTLFPNLPEVISPTADSLTKALDGKITLDGDDGLLRNYLLGLAYLNGVRVEVDRERGARLIKKAADGDYLPAITQLYDMYENGNGVARSYDEAIAWRKRAVDILENQYNNDKNAHNLATLYDELSVLAWTQKINGDLTEAAKQYSRLFTICKNAPFDAQDKLGAAASECAEIVKKSGDVPKAVEYYLFALKIYEKLYAEQASVGNALELANIYSQLGDSYSLLGDSRAGEYLAKGVEYALLANRDYNVFFTANVLSNAYNALGRYYIDSRENEKALGQFMQSLDLRKSHSDELRTNGTRRALAAEYINVATTLDLLGRYDEQLDSITNAITLLSQVVEATGLVTDRQLLIDAYLAMARAQNRRGQYKTGYEAIMAANDIHNGLAKKQDELTYMATHYSILLYTGETFMAMGMYDKAIEYFTPAVISALKVCTLSPSTENRHNLVQLYKALGYASFYNKQADNAVKYYTSGIEHAEDLVRERGNGQDYFALCALYAHLGEVYLSDDLPKSAQEVFELGCNAADKLIAIAQTDEFLIKASTCYSGLGDALYAQNEENKAIDYYVKAYEIARTAYETSQSTSACRQCGLGAMQLGFHYVNVGKVEIGFEYYKIALPLLEDVAFKLQTAAALDDYASIEYRLAALARNVELASRAAKVWAMLSAQPNANPAYQLRLKAAENLIKEIEGK